MFFYLFYKIKTYMVTSTVWPEVKKKKMVPAFEKMPFEKTIKILEILAYNHVYFSA